jgi:subfamily B ATP-binding cassette protein MsbA
LFNRFARPFWRSLFLLLAVSLTTAFFTFLQPLVLSPAIDTALLTQREAASNISDLNLNNLGPTLLAWFKIDFKDNTIGLLVTIAVLYIIVVAMSAGMSFAGLQIMRWIRTGMANEMQSILYEHVLALPMSFFVRQRVGELSNRVVYDVVQAAGLIDPIMRGLTESSLQIAFYGLLMLRSDSQLTLIIGCSALLHLAITRVLRDRIRRWSGDQFDVYAELVGRAQETLMSIRIVKSFASEEFEQERFVSRLKDLQRVALKFGWYQNFESSMREVANAVVLGIVLIFAFDALSAGRLTSAGFVLFIFITRQLIAPFSQIGNSFLQIQNFIGASTRILQILHTETESRDGTSECPKFQSKICLENISFVYDSSQPILREVSFEIPKGSMIALVGPSGAGKSTLADLLLRFYDVTNGKIMLDGVDIRTYKLDSYRKLFGVVPQESLLFNASIEDNIAYGRPVNADRIQLAAEIANAVEFVEQLPDRYSTIVGDRGIRLSGGQKQRIAIARAIYDIPEILILDEATSSLDSESEQSVQEAIGRVVKHCTAIVIAHRLSTIVKADQVIVLNEGQIVDRGKHSALLGTSDLYRRLWNLQNGDRFAPALNGLLIMSENEPR